MFYILLFICQKTSNFLVFLNYVKIWIVYNITSYESTALYIIHSVLVAPKLTMCISFRNFNSNVMGNKIIILFILYYRFQGISACITQTSAHNTNVAISYLLLLLLLIQTKAFIQYIVVSTVWLYKKCASTKLP